MDQTIPRLRCSPLPIAAYLALLAALALWAAPAQARERGSETTRASCSGAVAGNSFHFSCDKQIGGNTRGWLFGLYSRSIADVHISSPGGIACGAEHTRMICTGPAIPAGTTVSGSFGIRPSEEEPEEEGEGACPGGISIVVIAYGGDSPEGEPGENEEGEGEVVPAPIGLARFGISSCSKEEGPRGTQNATFSLGKVKLNRERGTATLPVKVSAAGTLTLRGENLIKVTKTVKAAGTVRLTVKARGAAKALLHATGKARVKASVTYTPSGGEPATKSKKITLKLV